MSEQHAHPVALKAGEVPTINLWDLLDQAQAQERDLRAKLAAAEAECGRLLARDNEECCTDYKTMLIEQRDAARRDLVEAMEWMRGQLGTNAVKATAIEAKNHIEQGHAILARHAQPERRKGEKERRKEQRYHVDMRRGPSDRRKQPAVDWQAEATSWHNAHIKKCCEVRELTARATAAEAECERLRLEISGYNKTVNALMEELPISRSNELEWEEEVRCAIHGQTQDIERLSVELAAANARAEAAEKERDEQEQQKLRLFSLKDEIAKTLGCFGELVTEAAARVIRERDEALAKLDKAEQTIALYKREDLYAALQTAEAKLKEVRAVANATRRLGYSAVARDIEAILDSPAPEKREEWPELLHSNYNWPDWAKQVQRRIEATEARLDKMEKNNEC